MMEPDDAMNSWSMTEQTALAWVIRQRDPDFDDWDGFTNWLEADATHADLYHRMALADGEMAGMVAQLPPSSMPSSSTPLPANDDTPGRLARWRWAGGAIAAALVAVISIGVFLPRADPWQVETRPGERRAIALADGSHVILNGGTRLVLDRKDARIASLETGEAMFIVRHDESDPFEVTAGQARLVDVGTAFNVVRQGGSLDVAVSEGAVLYNPDGEAARIDAGDRLNTEDGAGSYSLSKVDAADVASWRDGRLVYDGQPLSTVAADLSRYYGEPVTASPKVAARLFRGVLSLPPKGSIDTLAPVLDAEVIRTRGGWTLSPRP